MIRAVAVAAVLLAAFLGATAVAQKLAPRPVATAADVMEHLVVPASNAVFRTSSELPNTDAEWKTLRGQAVLLAESGNLLLIGAPAKDNAEWLTNAALLRDATEKFIKTLGTRDIDVIAAASEEVYVACEQCHAKYLGAGR